MTKNAYDMSNPTKSDMPIHLVMSPGSLEVKVRLKGQGHGKKQQFKRKLEIESDLMATVCVQKINKQKNQFINQVKWAKISTIIFKALYKDI